MEDIMQQRYAVPRRRPFGVTIIAILLFISAVIEIIGGLFFLLGSLISNPLAAVLGGWIPLAVAILSFILAWGLWTLRPWAYWATVILEVINIVSHLFGFGQTPHTLFGIFAGGLISVIILLYMLLDRNAREAFRV
jgi:hypothetical protein